MPADIDIGFVKNEKSITFPLLHTETRLNVIGDESNTSALVVYLLICVKLLFCEIRKGEFDYEKKYIHIILRTKEELKRNSKRS